MIPFVVYAMLLDHDVTQHGTLSFCDYIDSPQPLP